MDGDVVKILIINIDSTIENFALAKIKCYHSQRGDEIFTDYPLACTQVDKIYVSCIFTKNRDRCDEYSIYDHAVVGGSGYDLKTELPPEIESVHPHINLGFASRGCIRKCGFCIVPEKEGMIRPVADLLDLWDGKSKRVMLMDNNILALPDHFRLVCEQARTHKINIDFNQGLDHRLLTNDIAEIIKHTPMQRKRFSFDHPGNFNTVSRAIDTLDRYGIYYNQWYVLVGYNTTLSEDLERLNYLRERRQRAFVQRYRRDPVYIPLAQWAARRDLFAKMTFREYLHSHGGGRYRWVEAYL